MYKKYSSRPVFGYSIQDRLNKIRSSVKPNQSLKPVMKPVDSKIVKDMGNGKVSILGKTYDKKLVEEKMKEVDNIVKTMSLPEIKKKFGI